MGILGNTSHLKIKALAFVYSCLKVSFVAQAAVKHSSSQLSSARISE